MIEITELGMSHCEEIADILSTDESLHQVLLHNIFQTPITGTEYLGICRLWERAKRGKCYAILLDQKPIGTISYSHIDDQTAGCGYWIGSSYWNKGYTTAAVKLLILIVKAQNYKFLTANILKNNVASYRIWQRYGAEIIQDDGKFYPKIDLDQFQPEFTEE